MTPTTEEEAVATSGGSRHKERSSQTWSIVFAFGRQRVARSAKEYEARAPAGAQPRLGPVISVMTPITEAVVAVTLGRSSHDTLPSRSKSKCVVYASRKQREAHSVRETAKAAADGAHRRSKTLPGPCLSVMTPTTVEEAVPIAGIWIVPHYQMPSFVQGTARASKETARCF